MAKGILPRTPVTLVKGIIADSDPDIPRNQGSAPKVIPEIPIEENTPADAVAAASSIKTPRTDVANIKNSPVIYYF